MSLSKFQVVSLSCLVSWAHSGDALYRERNRSDDDDVDQIVGGTPAAKGEFPYQVSYQYLLSNGISNTVVFLN